VEIEVYQDFNGGRGSDGWQQVTPGLKSLFAERRSVNRIGPGRYQVVTTGEVLTSDAPDAP
jgi:hypothetical protein